MTEPTPMWEKSQFLCAASAVGTASRDGYFRCRIAFRKHAAECLVAGEHSHLLVCVFDGRQGSGDFQAFTGIYSRFTGALSAAWRIPGEPEGGCRRSRGYELPTKAACHPKLAGHPVCRSRSAMPPGARRDAASSTPRAAARPSGRIALRPRRGPRW